MRHFGSWHDYVTGASTLADVLDKTKLTSDFAMMQQAYPRLASFAAWAIEQTLRAADDDEGSGGGGGPGGRGTSAAFATTIRKANQRARQLRLNLTPDDELGAQEKEHLLKEVEKIIEILTGSSGDYVFFNDPDVGDVTLRGAKDDLRLWDKVINALVEMAGTARMHDDFALKAVRIAREIARRLRK